MIPRRFAVVVAHNRPALLVECVAAIGPQVDTVIVVDNASDPPVDLGSLLVGMAVGHEVALIKVPDQPVNLPRLWNKGIGVAAALADVTGPCHIAVLCDDAIVPLGWFDAVIKAMADTGAAVGCSSPWTSAATALKTAPDSDLMGRMTGWAWILDAASTVRPDESMAFWWCDTDIDWQARQDGGMVSIGGYPVENRLPNDHLVHVPGLGEQTGRDGEAFVAKWGPRPW
jgi:hypothetical protein